MPACGLFLAFGGWVVSDMIVIDMMVLIKYNCISDFDLNTRTALHGLTYMWLHSINIRHTELTLDALKGDLDDKSKTLHKPLRQVSGQL